MASWLALGKAPAFAQKRELTFLSWNHFVPAADDDFAIDAGFDDIDELRVDRREQARRPRVRSKDAA